MRNRFETLQEKTEKGIPNNEYENFVNAYLEAAALKLKKAQNQLAGIYLKEQTEYIQNQIDKIRDSMEDRKSRIAWQTINEVSKERAQPKQN